MMPQRNLCLHDHAQLCLVQCCPTRAACWSPSTPAMGTPPHSQPEYFRWPKTFEPRLMTITVYRVTHHIGQNLQLTSKQKFRFGLACPDLARSKRYF